MGQALYRKYRSKNLAEVVGQEHITDTLSQALKSGRISHAYLFTGPRGTGKTSVARILAHELNGLSYASETNHVDIIEIDAASNRGIDEIRDLREKVYNAPLSARYKVYIIDEVHMLTTPAFNALLKTLEEPPEHVIFILATTEAHKLPETIVSRTQRHVFRPVEQDKVVGHLKHIAKSEKIGIDDEALVLLAAHGGGSFRDSISLLDQAGSGGQKVDRKAVEALLGLPPDEQLVSLLASATSGRTTAVLVGLADLMSRGFQPAAIAKKIGDVIRQQLLEGDSAVTTSQLAFLQDLLEVAPSADPARRLEIALLRFGGVNANPVIAPKPVTRRNPARTDDEKSVDTIVSEPIKAGEQGLPEKDTVGAPEKTMKALDPELWGDILDALKRQYNTLYGVMRMAVPEFEAGVLRLRFQFAFHQKRMNEAKHRAIVGAIVEQLTGQTIVIECIHDKEALLTGPIGSTHPGEKVTAAADKELSTISNIFGGAELLES
jgi:DNA polymerase-3 subunit gamma/tau